VLEPKQPPSGLSFAAAGFAGLTGFVLICRFAEAG
jgi:hypothetical protein